jgi:hypothetical protein
VDVAEQALDSTQEGREPRLPLAPANHVAVWQEQQFEQPGCSQFLAEQAPQDRLEVLAHPDGTELSRRPGESDQVLGWWGRSCNTTSSRLNVHRILHLDAFGQSCVTVGEQVSDVLFFQAKFLEQHNGYENTQSQVDGVQLPSLERLGL